MKTRIGDIADVLPVKVHEDDTLGRALQLMKWCRIRHLPVMRGDTLVGVLSERDVLRRYAEIGRLEAEVQPIRTAMRPDPVTVAADEDLWAAIRLMVDNGIGCLPVVSDGQLGGLVTRSDLLARMMTPAGADDERGPEAEAAPPRAIGERPTS